MTFGKKEKKTIWCKARHVVSLICGTLLILQLSRQFTDASFNETPRSDGSKKRSTSNRNKAKWEKSGPVPVHNSQSRKSATSPRRENKFASKEKGATGMVADDANARRLLSSNHDFQLQHMWNCSADTAGIVSPRPKKLIFLHVFKTAGSSFREFFRQYSSACKMGLSIIIGCSGLLQSSVPDSPWISVSEKSKNADEAKCIVKDHYWRDTNLHPNNETAPNAMTDSFFRKETDLLVGHVSMGATADLESDQFQYVTFFRESYKRFVSGWVYFHSHKGKMTFEEAIDGMKKTVRKKVDAGIYSSAYSPYLLTPEQKLEHATVVEKVNQIKQNLVDYNIMTGIVEFMGESLDLLAHMIDLDQATKSKFDKLDPRVPKEKGLVQNPSHLSTSALVNELKKDKEFMVVLDEYVKYDVELYDFAVRVHKKQVEATLGARPQ